MDETRLLLCTDMDRTIIPNGLQPEHPQARKWFAEFCSQPQITLVYVTGRHQKLVKEAIKNYHLPCPHYAITDVGTRIYRIVDQQWQPLQEWSDEIAKDWHGKSHQQLKQLFADIPALQLQESGKQNSHKLSYYVAQHVQHNDLLLMMKERLEAQKVEATLVWSMDEPKAIGLLDVLPRNATKLHAIHFLRQQLNYSLGDILFAGDSGNDLHVLSSEIPSVLVANATGDIRDMAQAQSQQHNTQPSLYLASGKNTPMNGNYAAGVLEGISYFLPAFRPLLTKMGAYCEK